MDNSDIIKFEIPKEADREKIISGFANSGYKVWIGAETHYECWGGENKYFVFVELKKNKINS